MLITNKITDYSMEQQKDMQDKVKEFVTTIKELDAIIEKEVETPTTGSDNVIHLDMTVFTEYSRLGNQSFPLHEILVIYDRWIEKLNYLVKVNIGQYKTSPKLIHFMIQLRAVCLSFVTNEGGEGQTS